MWNTEEVEAPDHLERRLGRRRQLRGQAEPLRLARLHRRCLAAPDGDAARPGHHQPIPATQEQFDAAIALLEEQFTHDPLFWNGSRSATRSPSSGRRHRSSAPPGSTRSTAWSPNEAPVRAIKPAEGATGWSDTWMIAKDAAHPNCMYMWMDHMMSAEANAQATIYFGEASTSQEACDYAETFEGGLYAGTLRADPRDRRGVLGGRLVLEHRPRGLRGRGLSDDLRGLRRLGRGLDHAPGRLTGPLRDGLTRCSPEVRLRGASFSPDEQLTLAHRRRRRAGSAAPTAGGLAARAGRDCSSTCSWPCRSPGWWWCISARCSSCC